MAPYFLNDKYSMAVPYTYYDNLSNRDNPKGLVGDYAHASALYRRNNFRLAPKVGFLYHVTLDVNPLALSQLGPTVQNLINKREVNLLVSTVDLPSYSVESDTKNTYNRKKVVQTRLNYDPVALIFHDDQAGLTTLLWESYFRYYYQDANYSRKLVDSTPDLSVPTAYRNGMYSTEILNRYRHGLDRPKNFEVPFFNSITINQLHSQNAKSNFTSITLINPLIEALQHASMAQDETGTLKTTMRIKYEGVMYNRGITAIDNPPGFADPAHYDVTPSPIQKGDFDLETKEGFNILDVFLGAFVDNLLVESGLQTQFNINSQNNLPLEVQPVTTSNTFNLFNNFLIPTNNNVDQFTLAVPNQTQGVSLSQQEFIRQLQNNPKKLDDFAKVETGLIVSQDSGLTVAEGRQFYDGLSITTKTSVQASALRNATNLTNSQVSNDSFKQDLSSLGII